PIGARHAPATRLERDDFSSNRHPAPAFWWSVIFSENRCPPRIKSGAGFSGSCFLAEHDLFRKPVSTFRDHALGGWIVGEGARYAIYLVPAAESHLYQFGCSVLAYDCYTGETVRRGADFGASAAEWDRLTEEPRRYGFHATLKARFHLSPACSEEQLISAVQSFAELSHSVPTIAPIVRMLSGFAGIVPARHEAATGALATKCTTMFDRFRAPMSPQERAQRLALGLNPGQIQNLERWGYPFLFSH